MKLRRRHLTLLEVLISLTLIVCCLFPLLSPHVTYYKTQRQLANRFRTTLEASNWYATFYEELLIGERAWESLPFETPLLIDKFPEKATYVIKNEIDKTGEKGISYLLKLLISTEHSGEFEYYFVVIRKANENQKEAPDAA